MASPFGKPSSCSPVATCGSIRGGVNPLLQQPACQEGFGFGIVSPFAVPPYTESAAPANPFLQPQLLEDGSTTSQTKEGSFFLGHAYSSSPFSFGISPSFGLEHPGDGDQEMHKNPSRQRTPFGCEIFAPQTSQTSAHSLNTLTNQSTSSFSTGKASPFAVSSIEHNPFQQSKAVGSREGLPYKNSQTTKGSLIFGHASTSPLSFGKSPAFTSPSSNHDSKNPFKQSRFLAGKSFAAATSQPMAGSSMQGNAPASSFPFQESSPFAISSNIHKPEPKNPFRKLTPNGNRSTWSQKETVGSTTVGAGSSFIMPFGQPASCQNPWAQFASDPLKHP